MLNFKMEPVFYDVKQFALVEVFIHDGLRVQTVRVPTKTSCDALLKSCELLTKYADEYNFDKDFVHIYPGNSWCYYSPQRRLYIECKIALY